MRQFQDVQDEHNEHIGIKDINGQKILINAELVLGEDTLSPNLQCKEFNDKKQNLNSKNKPQWGKDEEQVIGSSIFTSTPFRDNGPFGH